ncbi:DUF4214 domain-containing protein [Paenibacillus koleovorans]|uniref:DUF4214 domain-containing protein n=1 Tax=Paenibacillus koleovorans TaxID=121608 RepID=UPI000FD707E7|nr:DUF4214 domain-containing protein [Paenibacillus koleovorans]
MIAQRLYKAIQLDDHGFLHAAYRELLNREPDPSGFQSHLQALHSGTGRRHILAVFMQSPEAGSLYSLRGSGTISQAKTVAEAMKLLTPLPAEAFAKQIYRELFSRNPDPSGKEWVMKHLQNGRSRHDVAGEMLGTPEFGALMNLNRHDFAKELLNRLVQTFYT